MPPFAIPEHKGCRNCGACCGIVPASKAEAEEIDAYLVSNPSAREVAIANIGKSVDCPFRDRISKQCAIYPVRPATCRLMGVARGLDCDYGNSAEIDGYAFLQDSYGDKTIVLNFQDWRIARPVQTNPQREKTRRSAKISKQERSHNA